MLFKTCGTFSPEEKLIRVLTVLGPIIGIRARLFMGTNKERIEQLKDGLHRMELCIANRLRQVEENLNHLSDVLLENSGNPILGSITNREGNGGERLVVSSKTAKLEFPRFSGDDPTKWFNRVNQFFEFQNTPKAQKVSLASYHLEGEANQWW